MTDAVTVDGAPELARSLDRLGRELDDLEPADLKAAQLLLDRAGPRTPRRSGALAGSGRATADPSGGQVQYAAVYAGVIHNGWAAHGITAQPWLAETVHDQTDAAVGVYRDYIEDLVSHVEGA